MLKSFRNEFVDQFFDQLVSLRYKYKAKSICFKLKEEIGANICKIWPMSKTSRFRNTKIKNVSFCKKFNQRLIWLRRIFYKYKSFKIKRRKHIKFVNFLPKQFIHVWEKKIWSTLFKKSILSFETLFWLEILCT